MATKVFVGNLSFKTKESELSDEFSVVGRVVSANIIIRGNRSLGYGFVEFEKEQDAQSALQSLNRKSINGREINVELATPRQEGAPRPPNPRRGGFRGGFRGGRGRGGSSYNRGDAPYNNRGDAPYNNRGGDSPYNRGGDSPSSQNSPSNNNENNEGENNQSSPRGRGVVAAVVVAEEAEEEEVVSEDLTITIPLPVNLTRTE